MKMKKLNLEKQIYNNEVAKRQQQQQQNVTT